MITQRVRHFINMNILMMTSLLLCLSTNLYADVSEYDFIVVGAGAGGGTLAARLAEKKHAVLLLEAGPEKPSLFYKTPVAFSLASEDPFHAWAYYVEHYQNGSEPFLKDSKAMCSNDLIPIIKTRCNVQDNGDCTCPVFTSREGIFYPRGTGLGGSTANNAMINVMPKNSDWENIANITGDPSWRSANMKQYHDNMREWVNPKIALADNVYNSPNFHHGDNVKYQAKAAYNTLFPVENGENDHSLEDVIDDLDQRANGQQPSPKDLNKLSLDADPLQGTPSAMVQIPLGVSKGDGYRTGTRERILAASCKADVLRPDTLSDEQRVELCKSRGLWNDQTDKPYLTVQTDSLATRVIFSSEQNSSEVKRVIGVEYLEGGLLYKASIIAANNPQLNPQSVYANKEVILSAGAFNSPQLLMQSGIGDINLFKRSDIKVAHQRALPGVGKNLQEHYEMGIAIQTPENNQWAKDCLSLNLFKTLSFSCLGSLLNLENGNMDDTFAATNASIGSYLVRSFDEDESLGITPYSENGEPDIHAFGIPSKFTGYFNGYSLPAFEPNKFTWLTLKGHTKHRGGTVTLKTDNPLDYPRINFNFYEDGDEKTAQIESGELPNENNPVAYDDSASSYDLGAMVASVKLIRRIIRKSNQLYNQDHGLPEDTALFKEIWAGANAVTDDELRDVIRAETFGHHPTSTAAIGADDDPYAVLDSEFRVRGIAGLRVVDASTFPRVPGTFITVPIYILAEKAADVIDNYHQLCEGETCFTDIVLPDEELHPSEPPRTEPQVCNAQSTNSSSFVSGVQTHSESNYISYKNGQGYDVSIGSWSILRDLQDTSLAADNVLTHYWFWVPPCESGQCKSSGQLAKPLSAGEFYSNWDKEVHPNVAILDYKTAKSGKLTQFDSINVGRHSRYTFDGEAETTYRINELRTTGGYSTLTFTPGDYWIESLYLDDYNNIVVDQQGAGTGTVRLFVKNVEYVGQFNNWNTVNNGANPERLVVYSYNDFKVSRGTYSGFFYSEKNIISESFTNFKGSLLADNIKLANNNRVWSNPKRDDVNFGPYICW